MVMINDIRVNTSSFKPVIKRKVGVNMTSGSNKNPIDVFGFANLKIDLEGYVTSRYDYDTLMQEMNDNVSVKLYKESDWYYYGVITQITPDATPSDEFFPLRLTMLCESPYVFSDEENTYTTTVNTSSETIGDSSITTDGSANTVAGVVVTSQLATGIIVSQTDRI